jgi:hypothetical protein
VIRLGSSLNHRRAVLLVTAMILAVGVTSMSSPSTDLTSLLPDDIGGWRTAGDDQAFTPENLFDYINGGAELYLSYGFNQVLSRTYSNPDRPDIIADIFDMGSSQNAFGVFSHSREIVDDAIGQGSQYTSGLMLFWKDRYYVSILASPETAETKEAVFELARHIDNAIPGEGPLPGILDLLPQDSLDNASVRYFHHYIWLNSHYYVADENIFHIEKDTDAVLAKYDREDSRYLLLVIKYPDAGRAEEGMEGFVTHYAPELDGGPVVQIEDGTWTGCRRTDAVLSVVFNAGSGDAVLKLLDDVEKNIDAHR